MDGPGWFRKYSDEIHQFRSQRSSSRRFWLLQVFAWIILLYILQLKLHPAIEIMGLLVSFIWIAKQGNTGKRDIWVLNIHECTDHIPAPQRTRPFVFECHPRENLHYREVCKNSYISCLFCMRVYILDPGKRSLVDLVELNLHDDWANSSRDEDLEVHMTACWK